MKGNESFIARICVDFTNTKVGGERVTLHLEAECGGKGKEENKHKYLLLYIIQVVTLCLFFKRFSIF